MLPGRSSSQDNLILAAQLYRGIGYSVIPLSGDANRPKSPAVAWKSYQQRRASDDEMHTWFVEQQHGALGIVTGSVSGLVVLDFDQRDAVPAFAAHCPHLTQTRTVQTRRGVHLYFRVPPHLHVASRKLPGVDLLSDGHYAVAPPSVIDGHEYTLIRGGLPRLLTPSDIAQIDGFLSKIGGKAGVRPAALAARAQPPSERKERHFSAAPASPDDLIGLYRHLAPQRGRNEALFAASLRARDTGWSLEQVVELLADRHAHQLSVGPHRRETPGQRRDEAVRTIRSAFSRPPRPALVQEPAQLPNRVREALFQCGLTCTVRVIEGLRFQGIQPGDAFTEAQARRLLAGLVGQHSIRQSLTAEKANGERLIERLPLPPPMASSTLPKRKHDRPIPPCSEMGPSTSKLSRDGRPTHRYRMPTNAELAERLGVRRSLASDPLTLDDLRSAAATRQAAHREFIKRRAGCYPCKWLARRLGVSAVTEQRYNRLIPIHVVPMYHTIPISWRNLSILSDDLEVNGLFLEDHTGRRYPVRVGIARWLLGQGREVALKRQQANFYYYGDKLPPPPPNVDLNLVLREAAYAVPAPPHGEPRPVAQAIPASPRSTAVKPVAPEPAPRAVPLAKARAAKLRKQTTSPPTRQRMYRRPLADPLREALAQRVYTLVGRLSVDRPLSLPNARRLADRYSGELIGRALQRLGRDHTIRNPAGWLLVFLRSESKWMTEK